MKESDQRMRYIADYISSYEEKIHLLNSKGLFDTAKLFELFALEICRIIFNKGFLNLSIYTFTYPHVDLISEDGELYVQVSTAKDIPSKIKNTLEDIRDSKKKEISNVKTLKFFMLNNDSVNKVKNYKDKNQIGNISFDKDKDLITTKTILDKAMDKLEFQLAIYDLIKKDTESIKENSKKLSEAIERCKILELQYINCLINNEYEIDRKNIVDEIGLSKAHFFTVLGGPGSGKSVICKKTVETNERVIFARAERFLECNSVNDIWDFNIRETFQMLGDSKLVIFIDALEFIADSHQKIYILHELYQISNKFKNIRIIASCRTSDFNSFIKINETFEIKLFEVSELNEIEINEISKKYPIISKMTSITTYKELLRNPLYINIIVSNLKNIDDIVNENQLREYIWNNVICLKSKAKDFNLKHNEIINVVESIVFDRASNFLLGSNEKLYDSNIIKALLSENVLIRNGKTVRLKYDVFEDIAFEQYFDNEFDECKGDYQSFFDSISKIGRCVFRRYQIWISNKLLAKENRAKFLREIVFSNETPEDWKKQTQIGLVKSRYSTHFFEEYKDLLVSTGLLFEFLKITNLYGFEIDNDSFKKYISLLELRPVGQGRSSLINIIYEKKLYEIDGIKKRSVQKLCSDFSKVKNRDKQTESFACSILEYYIGDYLYIFKNKQVHGLDEEIIFLLKPLYEMVESSKDWIVNFWDTLKSLLLDEDKARFAAKVIENTLGAIHVILSKFLPDKLCELAEFYWTHTKNPTRQELFFHERDRFSNHHIWGLNEYAEEYNHNNYNSNPRFSSFFFALLKTNYGYGLEWLIKLLNKLSLEAVKNSGIKSPAFDLYFVEEHKHRKYYGDFSMWTVGTKENNLPMIINDFVYLLKEEIIFHIKNEYNTEKKPKDFAEKTKKMIYEQSNNIILLSVISDIGKEFFDTVPGYSIDLISSFYLIYQDLSKIALLMKNPTRELLEKQILLTVGIPDLPDRYKTNYSINPTMDIRDYARYCQFSSIQLVKKKCLEILDYLYSITPNDIANGRDYLQIQNMDMRNASFNEIGNGLVEMVPKITGEAKKIVEENESQMTTQVKIGKAIIEFNEKGMKSNITLNDTVSVLETILENRGDDVYSTIYEKTIIDLIGFVLNTHGLSKQLRNKYCLIWIEGIESYFSNGSLIFEHSLVRILFEQIDKEIDEDVRKRIEKLIIDCILFSGDHGVLFKISTYAKQYLRNNASLSHAVFNTIFKLAQDEMSHQKYNWDYLKPIENGAAVDFKPNLHRRLNGVDYQIMQKNEVGYVSQKSEIICNLLYDKRELVLNDFDINDYDINLICNAFNFGVALDDSLIKHIAKSIVITMINIWNENRSLHASHEILDIYSQFEFSEFLENELINDMTSAERTLDLLFEDIDFDKFVEETYDFYENVLGKLLVVFFDSHSLEQERSKYKNIIDLLEIKILKIKSKNTTNELLKTVILSISNNFSRSDWSKCNADYSYLDKVYLNSKFSSYGYLHLKEMLHVIHKLHYVKLLPEIVISMNDAFKKAIDYNSKDSSYISKFIFENKHLILQVLYKAYVEFSDQIKQDKEMTLAFENILETIVECNHEEFAVILDEFRIH